MSDRRAPFHQTGGPLFISGIASLEMPGNSYAQCTMRNLKKAAKDSPFRRMRGDLAIAFGSVPAERQPVPFEPIQEKWKPVFRPELHQMISCRSRKSGKFLDLQTNNMPEQFRVFVII